jgi:ABC-type antimicrobial peptide transport system permease subunit
VAYRVAQRQKEIAIRVALGSPGWRITSTVLHDTLASVASGIAIGVPLALGAAGLVRSYLFGVDATDAVTLATAIATVLAAALVAAALPARRAPRVDPITALRAD